MGLLSAGPRYSLKRVITTILLSTLPLCLALIFVQKQAKDIPIYGIVQTGKLPTTYLAEILQLSSDQPTLFSEFDFKQGKQKLLQTFAIKEATIRKIKSGILLIDYQLRTPIALLGGYANTAIDQEGVLFPLLPAYFPQKLPLLFLPLENPKWGDCVQFDHKLLNEKGIIQIDLTHPREVILKMEGGDYVRLEKSTQQLPYYYKLQAEILKSPAIVDLRLKDCAFIQEIHE